MLKGDVNLNSQQREEEEKLEVLLRLFITHMLSVCVCVWHTFTFGLQGHFYMQHMWIWAAVHYVCVQQSMLVFLSCVFKRTRFLS